MRLRFIFAFSCLIVLAFALQPALAQHTYLGAEKCGKMCHKVEFTSWSASKHAKAFESLKPADQAKADCVGCHVTGGKKEMPGVQCEECHGAGSDYNKLAVMKDKAKAVAAGLIVATTGVVQGVIPEEVFSVVVILVLLTTLVTPLMLRAVFAPAADAKSGAAA